MTNLKFKWQTYKIKRQIDY